MSVKMYKMQNTASRHTHTFTEFETVLAPSIVYGDCTYSSIQAKDNMTLPGEYV